MDASQNTYKAICFHWEIYNSRFAVESYTIKNGVTHMRGAV